MECGADAAIEECENLAPLNVAAAVVVVAIAMGEGLAERDDEQLLKDGNFGQRSAGSPYGSLKSYDDAHHGESRYGQDGLLDGTYARQGGRESHR